MEDKQIVAMFIARDPDAIEQAQLKYDRLCRDLTGKILQRREDVEECLGKVLFVPVRLACFLLHISPAQTNPLALPERAASIEAVLCFARIWSKKSCILFAEVVLYYGYIRWVGVVPGRLKLKILQAFSQIKAIRGWILGGGCFVLLRPF